jgi:hypothetical protein
MAKDARALCAVGLVVALLAAPGTSAASADASSVVSPAELDRAVEERLQSEERSRSVVLGLMRDAEVAALAGGLGLDLKRAEEAVSSLGGAELASLAEQAERLEGGLAGGGTGGRALKVALLVLLVVLLALVVAEPL